MLHTRLLCVTPRPLDNCAYNNIFSLYTNDGIGFLISLQSEMKTVRLRKHGIHFAASTRTRSLYVFGSDLRAKPLE